MTNDKIKSDINSYHDIVSDLRGVWEDLNGILDMKNREEIDILMEFQSIIDGFEGCVFESMELIRKESHDD